MERAMRPALFGLFVTFPSLDLLQAAAGPLPRVGRDLHRVNRPTRQACYSPPASTGTARLACQGEKGNSLARLLDRHQLTAQVTRLAPASQPHRALWDATGAALLLRALAARHYPHGASIRELLSAVGAEMTQHDDTPADTPVQGELFT
jgi:hypothetical protein